ncbi:MAG TPA: proton-conducting transporter membrane subunit [Stellaceae bacterium]|nr:proton-conducting transporter membrane subunit [Stellaceae bacterium]
MPVVAPFAAAALLMAFSRVLNQRISNAIALATAMAVIGACAFLFVLMPDQGSVVYWFGGWSPEHHVGIGIDFAFDKIGAGLALLTAVLASLALLYGLEYFRDAGPLLNVLVLVFLGGVTGMSLTGDVFNFFDFFELTNIAMYAMSAYSTSDENALNASISFIIINSLACFLFLFGITLLEAKTLRLNMAAIGVALTQSQSPTQGLVIGAFALMTAAFFIRAAVVPFHFWFVDTEGTAPTPLGLLLAAVGVELGLYAFARMYWSIFSGVFQHYAVLQDGLVALGAISSAIGSVMCLNARNLKRLLAFFTVSYLGLLLVGVGLLSPLGLAGVSLYLLTYAPAISSLLVCTGILVSRFSEVDEGELWGRGRALPIVGAIFAAATIASIGVPPLGAYVGRALLLEAAIQAGHQWIVAISVLASALTGAALIIAAGRIFLGLGPRPARRSTEGRDKGAGKAREEPQGLHERPHAPWFMLLPAAAGAGLSIAVSLIPELTVKAERAAIRFTNRSAYVANVLHNANAAVPLASSRVEVSLGVWSGALSTVLAVGIALAMLYHNRLPPWLPRAVAVVWRPSLLESLHSGKVNDYITIAIVGVALLGGLFFAAFR